MIWTHLKTIFSFRVYHLLTFASRRFMVGFGVYLFFLSAIVFYFFTSGYIQNNLPVLLKNFPQVTFEKGVLVQPQTPVSVSIPQSDFKITFDASLKTPPSADELLRTNTLLLVSANKLYMAGSGGVQTQQLPETFSFVTSQENLQKQQEALSTALAAVAFLTALMVIPFMLAFGFCLAAAAGLFFKLLFRSAVPRGAVFKWAFFMLGPLTALWYIRLWYPIPLFTFAQLILCIIYMQQIFNTLPEVK